jgi:tetratricopeptide (TPR) repeat protein
LSSPNASPSAPLRDDRTLRLGAALVLVAGSLLLFAPALDYGLVFDDRESVVENPGIFGGPTPAAIAWAFTTGYSGQWQPLVFVSFMLDVALFGPSPAGFHATNVVLHALNALLVFVLVLRLAALDRGGPVHGRSATLAAFAVAALFAFHPQHVEPVVWVSSRKDVLSGLAWLVSVLAYLRWAERGGRGAYGLSLLAFGAGLATKAMVVTLPFVLLLLDFWSLRRIGPEDLSGPGRREKVFALVREKIPFFALAGATSVITALVFGASGALAGTQTLPLSVRLANSVGSYLGYLEKAAWPAQLSVIYPYTAERIAAGRIAIAALVLGAVTLLAVRAARTRPWWIVGWLWFVGTLVPVIGIVQVGSHSTADRYTYLPHLGLWIPLAWMAAAAAARSPRLRPGLAALALLVAAACAFGARRALPAWRDDLTLFSQAIAATSGNYVALYNLGHALAEAGRSDEAVARYREAVALYPGYLEAHTNLAALLESQGELAEAESHFAIVARDRPDDPWSHYNLAHLHTTQRRFEDAEAALGRALAIDPDHVDALNLLGVARQRAGRPAEAVAPLEHALRVRPDSVEVRNNLGAVHRELGRSGEAVRLLEEAVRLRPGTAALELGLAASYTAAGRREDALAAFRRAGRLAPRSAAAAAGEADSFEALGRRGPALAAWRRASALAPDDAEIRLRLGLCAVEEGDLATAEEALRGLGRLDGGRAEGLERAIRALRGSGAAAAGSPRPPAP